MSLISFSYAPAQTANSNSAYNTDFFQPSDDVEADDFSSSAQPWDDAQLSDEMGDEGASPEAPDFLGSLALTWGEPAAGSFPTLGSSHNASTGHVGASKVESSQKPHQTAHEAQQSRFEGHQKVMKSLSDARDANAKALAHYYAS